MILSPLSMCQQLEIFKLASNIILLLQTVCQLIQLQVRSNLKK